MRALTRILFVMARTDLLALRAAEDPGGLALLDPPMTWSDLDRVAEARAVDFTAPVVPIDAPPGPEAVVALHAAARAGVALEPLSPGQPPSGAGAPEGTWTLLRTSGSTGEPRAIPLSRGNHGASAAAAEAHLSLTAEDRWLACLPFHHVGGLAIFVRSATTGFPVVPVWPFDPEAVMRAAAHHGVTAVSLVPTMLSRLLDAGWDPPDSLRLVLLGGAPCPPLLLQTALDRGVPVAPTYGMTETSSQVATLLPGDVAGHFGSAGRALPGVDLRAGEDGRIAVRGPMVSASAPTTDGWLVTNDLGLVNDGYLTVLGRADEAIVTGGEKVIPRTVEEVLLEDPAVAEAAVVGVPDPEWGERVIAAVTVRPGAAADAEALRELVRERLAPHMVPKDVVVVDALPRTGPDKLDRPGLRALLAEVGP